LFRLSVKYTVNKKPEDLHHVFLAKGHEPNVNSTERQARKMYFYNSNIFLFSLSSTYRSSTVFKIGTWC
jgi:hypothetical protein